MVSTYQSGRLIAVRAENGELNTHFRSFPSPMGIAVGRTSLALGTLRPAYQRGEWGIDVRTGALAGFLRFEGKVQEIFDIQTLQGIRYPEIAEPDSDLIATSFALPEAALAEVAR